MNGDGRLTGWLNNLNAVTWKTVLVGVLQSVTVCVVLYVWARKSLDQNDPHDMHTDTLNALLIFLAGLSGITLGGLAVKRTTDVDYQLAKNAGRAQTVQTGDNPMNVTATMPAVAAAPSQAPPAGPPAGPPALPHSRASGAVAVQQPRGRTFDPGA